MNSTFIHNKPKSPSLNDCGCRHNALGATPLNRDEQEAAKKSADDTVKEAEQYSNPNIPWPLKLTGLAVLTFLIFKT